MDNLILIMLPTFSDFFMNEINKSILVNAIIQFGLVFLCAIIILNNFKILLDKIKKCE